MLTTMSVLLGVALTLTIDGAPNKSDHHEAGVSFTRHDGARRLELRSASPRAAAARASQIQFLAFEFWHIYYGYEGPSYKPLEGEPPRGAQLVAAADVFATIAMATVRFEFVDTGGKTIAPLRFVKQNTAIDDGKFIGVVDVPDQPFRIAVSGTDLTGKPYRRIGERLFRSTAAPLPAPHIPEVFPADRIEKLKAALAGEDRKTKERLDQAGREHADGLIVMPRVEITDALYEPLRGERGGVIGIRLRYAARVPQDGFYRLAPQVSPSFASTPALVRGRVGLRTLDGSVDPLPEEARAEELADVLDRNSTGARYRAGVRYRFVIDLIPDFALRNKARTRFCITRWMFTPPDGEATWQAVVAGESPIRYTIWFDAAGYEGETEPFAAPGTFYRSLRAEGAGECDAGGNINF